MKSLKKLPRLSKQYPDASIKWDSKDEDILRVFNALDGLRLNNGALLLVDDEIDALVLSIIDQEDSMVGFITYENQVFYFDNPTKTEDSIIIMNEVINRVELLINEII